MKLFARLLLLILLVATSVALWQSLRYFRGDRIAYRVPAANSDTNFRRALRLEMAADRGLERAPGAWEIRVQKASYLAIQENYAEALEQLEEAARSNVAMHALQLEASIYTELQERTRAIEAFEQLNRLSVADPTVIQHLMRLYDETKDYAALRIIATEANMRWPNRMDSLMAIANSHINSPDQLGDLPLIMKYLVLAIASPDDKRSRPDPPVYERTDIQERLYLASDYLGYTPGWAEWKR